MIDSNEYKDQENKESDTALVPSELHILVTDADTNGYEISKMSDFMGLYAQQLTRSLADSPFVEVVSNIPVADLGIINNEERKCKICGKTIVDKNKTGICSACKKKAGDTGVTVMGVLALIGGAIWTGVKAFTKKD